MKTIKFFLDEKIAHKLPLSLSLTACTFTQMVSTKLLRYNETTYFRFLKIFVANTY